MNMESTVAGAESTEREDFTKVDTRLDEIKSMNMGDMSDDDLENVMAERKALRSQQAEMMGVAQVEATAENQERSDAEKVAEVAKAEAEAAAQVEKAKQIAERKQAETVQAETLLAEIKGGIEANKNVGIKSPVKLTWEEEQAEARMSREKKDPVFALERAYEGGYVTADDVRAVFDRKNFTPEQRKEALLDGIAAKLNGGHNGGGRSHPAPEVKYLMKEFGITKEDFRGTRAYDSVVNRLKSKIEYELKNNSIIVPGTIENYKSLLPDEVVDSQIRTSGVKTRQ